MPVVDQEEEITDIPCECCGFKTVFSSGFVVFGDEDDESEMEYVARWTDGKGDHDVFFLLYVESKQRYASVVFSFQEQAFSIIDAKDSDWGEIEANELLDRKDIIDTPLSEIILDALDEIWESDKSLGKFVEYVMLSRADDDED